MYDRFGFVLLAVASSIGLLLVVDLPGPTSTSRVAETALVTALTTATLVLALLASGVTRPFLRIGLVAVGLTLLWLLFSAVAAPSFGIGVFRLFWLVLTVATPFVVLRRVSRHRTVSVDTLMGAASVYLLLAVMFMYVFLAIDHFGEGAFFGSMEPTTTFMYFSLVTITTLGYGDFFPVSEEARAAAAIAAVVGQVYLVFVVARMVGLYTATSIEADAPED